MSIALDELTVDAVDAQLAETLLDVQRLTVIRNVLTGDASTVKALAASLNGHVQATQDEIEQRQIAEGRREPEPAPESARCFKPRVLGEAPERSLQLHAQGRLAEIRRQLTAAWGGERGAARGVSIPGSRRRAIEDAFALDPLRRFSAHTMARAIGDDRPDCVGTELAAIYNGPTGMIERVSRGVYRSTLVAAVQP